MVNAVRIMGVAAIATAGVVLLLVGFAPQEEVRCILGPAGPVGRFQGHRGSAAPHEAGAKPLLVQAAEEFQGIIDPASESGPESIDGIIDVVETLEPPVSPKFDLLGTSCESANPAGSFAYGGDTSLHVRGAFI